MPQKNYLRDAFDDCYDLLTRNKYTWPDNFNSHMKEKLIDGFIEYYQKNEDYEKCAELSRSYNELTKEIDDENSNKI
jgi:hypothetical protein